MEGSQQDASSNALWWFVQPEVSYFVIKTRQNKTEKTEKKKTKTKTNKWLLFLKLGQILKATQKQQTIKKRN